MFTDGDQIMIFANPGGLEHVAFLLASPNKETITTDGITEITFPDQQVWRKQ